MTSGNRHVWGASDKNLISQSTLLDQNDTDEYFPWKNRSWGTGLPISEPDCYIYNL